MPRKSDEYRNGIEAVLEARLALEGVRSLEPGRVGSVQAKKLRLELSLLAEEARSSAVVFDPVLRPARVFDPTHPTVSSHIVALALLAQPRHQLGSLNEFYGSGVYALYYTGDFPAYQPISSTEQPIYVGRARPELKDGLAPEMQGTALYKRLTEHARNIERAENLRIGDFECRFLVVKPGGESACEDYLIPLFRPVWNNETRICHGLGKHGDSATTRVNKRSPWDTLHPGRLWAAEIQEDQKPVERILAELADHFATYAIPQEVSEVISTIVADLEQFAEVRMQGVARTQ